MNPFQTLRPLLRPLTALYWGSSQKAHILLRNHASNIRKASTVIMPDNPIFQAIAKHDPKSIAMIHSESGRTFTYGSLLYDVSTAKERLLKTANGKPLSGERVAFLAENGYDYVGAQSTPQTKVRRLLHSHQSLSSPSSPTTLSRYPLHRVSLRMS